MDKYTELEKQAQRFLDETDTMQFSTVELLTMFYRHKQQLTLTDVGSMCCDKCEDTGVIWSEDRLSAKTCGCK